MKKTAIFKTLATIAAMLCLTTFISCESEDTLPKPATGSEYVKAIERYTVTLSEDFLYFYDVTATVAFGEDSVVTMKIKSSEWKYNEEWNNEVPGSFLCNVVATVKNPLPEVDAEKAYYFKTAATSILQLYDKTGHMSLPVWDNGSNANNASISLGGVEKITKYVTQNKKEVLILNSSYTIE